MKTSPQIAAPGDRAKGAALIISDGGQSRVVALMPGLPVVIGRDSDADVTVSGEGVSRRHVSLELKEGRVQVKDLGSTNGSTLNGVKIDAAQLNAGDELRLGGVTVWLHRPPALEAKHGALTHDQFLAALDEEIERAQVFRRGAAVAMLRLPDGDAAALASSLSARVRAVDRLGLYGDGSVELLMPEAGLKELDALTEALGPSLKRGVALYPTDGSSADALIETCRSTLRDPQPMRAVSSPSQRDDRPLYRSPAMRAVFEQATRVAGSVLPVLVRGESGTGKEVLVRTMHELSPRAGKRLAAINCGAIPSTLLESALFGHEKGSFTGATAAAPGLFEDADGGTVLLDEVGELPAAAQAALLRVLETKEIRRVGGTRDIRVDVRVIAATHRDLEAMVAAGTFREDLFYRLNGMTLELPALRERPDDIVPLCERFVVQANAANARSVKGFDAESMKLILGYPWPGNIRELRNAVEHAVVIAAAPLMTAADLPKKVRDFGKATPSSKVDTVPPPSSAEGDLRQSVQSYETKLILDALQRAGGNRSQAAHALQIPLRTLSNKIKQYGITQLGFGAPDR